MQKFTVSSSPHINSPITTQMVMFHVLLALLPTIIASGIIFGLRAIVLIMFCVLTAVLWEYISRIFMKRKQTISDLSAVVTGVLLALNLPVTIDLWMAAIGTFVAIVIVKQMFGGLGQNFANPAIVGRIVLFLSFSSSMTNWVKPFCYRGADMVSSATPLGMSNASYKDLFFGATAGCIGETCAFTLLIGGIYLVMMKIITPSIPLAFLSSVAILSYATGGDGLYQILSGGIMLGAIFMATDYVTSPVTEKGKIIFGVGCGIITFVIRKWGSFPEGVSFAILLMNIVTPYIDMATKPKPLGALKPKNKA